MGAFFRKNVALTAASTPAYYVAVVIRKLTHHTSSLEKILPAGLMTAVTVIIGAVAGLCATYVFVMLYVWVNRWLEDMGG